MCPRNPAANAKSAPQPTAYPPGAPPEPFPPGQPPASFLPGPPPLAFQQVPPPPMGQQFVVAVPPSPNQIPTWTTGLCDCFDDLSNCVVTFFCPCITFGQTAEVVDKGTTSCFCAGTVCVCLWYWFCCFCWYTCTYRSKLRALFSLPGDQLGDFCVHCWCTYCALCQEYRELKNRGLDPSAGWVGNQQKMQQAIPVIVPPAVPMGMMR